MRGTIWLGVAVLGTMLAAAGCSSTNCPCRLTAAKVGAKGMVRHVVLFSFKADAPPEKIKEIEAAFRALPSKVPGILGFEWGTNISPENHAQGYTHCFFLTFGDTKARDAYLPHPAHKAFGASLGPYLDKVLVIDYVAQD